MVYRFVFRFDEWMNGILFLICIHSVFLLPCIVCFTFIRCSISLWYACYYLFTKEIMLYDFFYWFLIIFLLNISLYFLLIFLCFHVFPIDFHFLIYYFFLFLLFIFENLYIFWIISGISSFRKAFQIRNHFSHNYDLFFDYL